MKKRVFVFIFVAFLICAVGPAHKKAFLFAKESEAFGEKDIIFGITSEEEEYLETLRGKKLILGVTENSAFDIDDEGNAIGTAVPLLRFMEYELDLDIEVVKTDWKEGLLRTKNQSLDFIFDYDVGKAENNKDDNTEKDGYSGGRDGKGLFCSEPIYESSVLMLVNQNNYSHNADELSGIKVGLVNDCPSTDYIMPYLSAVSEILYFESTQDMLKELKEQNIDACFITENAASAVYTDYELLAVGIFSQIRIPLGFATGNEEYKRIIEIFNRFLVATEEGDDFRKQINIERERYDIELFVNNEKKLIEEIKNKYKSVSYYAGEGMNLPVSYTEDGEIKGIVPEMFGFFSSITGIDFKAEENISSQWEAEEALLRGDINLSTGIIINQDNRDDFGFSESFYGGHLCVIGNLNDEEISRDEIKKNYWGCLAGVKPLLKSTLFEERVLVYDSVPELILAVNQGEIRGAVVNQGVLDFYNMQKEKKSIKRLTDISIPCSERISFRKSDSELGELVKKLVHVYRVHYPDYVENRNDEMVNYRNELVGYYSREVSLRNRLIAAAFIAAACLLAIVCIIYFTSGKIRRLNTKLKTLAQSNDKVDIIEVDLNKNEIKSSSGFEIFGLNPAGGKEQETTKLSELSEKTGFDFKKHYEAILSRNRDCFEMEYEIRGKDRSCYLREIGNYSGKYIVSTLFDISHEKEENKRLRKRAEIDGLTGLYNRSIFEEKICGIVERYPEELGVFAFINLNKFKQINDTYGHAVGDDILLSFGASIKKLSEGRDDTVVFRIGGDEFGAFRGNIRSKEEEEKFYSELGSLTMGAEAEGEHISAAYSLGISVYNRDAVALKDLMECADQAMYECKKNSG